MSTKVKQPKSKKVKVGTILDKDVLQRLKERAIKEGRPLNAVIEDAILRYEQDEALSRMLRVKALESVFATKFNISDEDLRHIMEEDYYEQ